MSNVKNESRPSSGHPTVGIALRDEGDGSENAEGLVRVVAYNEGAARVVGTSATQQLPKWVLVRLSSLARTLFWCSLCVLSIKLMEECNRSLNKFSLFLQRWQ